MLEILNKKITTITGAIILLLVSLFVGWLIVEEYKKIMEMRFTPLEVYGERPCLRNY